MLLTLKQFFLTRPKMLGWLDEMEAAGAARTLYLPPGLSPSQLKTRLEEVASPEAIPPELAGLAAASKTGGVFFWSPSEQYLVLPPFPTAEDKFVRGGAVEPLRSMLRHDFRIAVVLVRLGSYAVGLCQGERLVSSKVGTGLVHGRHRQGGSSAQRFHLHREKQIESFLERVCLHTRERLEPQARLVDYIVYGGARTTILRLQKQCPFLRQFDDRTLPPLLDIPDPRQTVLATAVGRAWSSRVFQWRSDETP